MKKTLRILILTALPFLSQGRVSRAADAPRAIAITARRFEFEPREIHLKVGETVKLEVTSADVAHGFFQRALKIDADVVPGKTSEVTVTPAAAGTFTLICDHFCGAQHGNMKMTIVVE